MEKSISYYILLFCAFLRTVHSISCYQCSGTDSENPFECNEYLDSDNDLVARDCYNIHDAQFCIKQVGRYEGVAIDCYQCNSSTTMECGDGLIMMDGGVITPKPCNHVYDAKFCIKETGGISTKRYCSPLDLGNYCAYVQQPGDKMERRTCIYTCGADGCNGTSNISISAILVTLSTILYKIFA